MIDHAFSAIPQRFANERVPDELLAQLHAANLRFHEARCHLEKAMGDADYGHQALLTEKENEVRRASRAVEEVDAKIRTKLNHHA